MSAKIIRQNTSNEGETPPTAPLIERESVLSAKVMTTETQVEQTLRPARLDDYLGQTELKEKLSISLRAAQQRGESLDHILLYGPPGLGKTTMAMVLAAEMDAPLTITAAPGLERPRDIVGVLMTLAEGSVLFIDEIHRLNRLTEEILYPAMEDFTLSRSIGKHASAKTIQVPLPKFTLIGATTKAGSLSNPLRDRFGLIHRLNYYTDLELQQILKRTAGILQFGLNEDCCKLLASRSRGTPRIANRLLRRVRDFAHVHNKPLCASMALEALALFDVDPLGLDVTDKLLLKTLIETFNGGPVGIESLAIAIGEDARTLEDMIEPYLVQAGLILRTSRGRMISQRAFKHLYPDAPIPEGFFQQSLLPGAV